MGRFNRARLREAGTDRVITLNEAECSAVIELGLRPTYGIVPCDDSEANISLMLDNAVLWLRAADVTSAGKAGRLPCELWPEVAALLDEAIPEALRDLWNTVHARDAFLSGAAGHGFPGLGNEEAEALYDDYVDGGRRLLSGLQSLDAQLADHTRRSAA